MIARMLVVLAAVALALGLAVYAYACAVVWTERAPAGRAAVLLWRLARGLVLVACAGLVMLAVIAAHLARWAARRGGRPSGVVRALVAPERWQRAAPACSPKLATLRGRVRRVGGYTATPSGGIYHVDLPGGVSHLDLAPEAVASAFRARSALVTRGTHGHRADVRVRYRDLLARPVPAPLPEWSEHRVTIGRDEDGAPLTVDLGVSHAALGGASRSGKSNALHQIIAAYAAHPDGRLYLLDGKEGAELGAWSERADGFDDGRDGEHYLALLRVVLDEVKRRNLANAAAGRRVSIDDAPVLVVVDEVASYSARDRGFDELLGDLMRRGLATGVRVVLATQKATRDSIPTLLRDLCETRVGFKCGSAEMGVAILGQAYGAYAAALPSPVEDPARNAGRCYVVVGDRATLGRAYHATPAWLRDSVAATRRPSARPAARGGGRAPSRAGAPAGEAGARAHEAPPSAATTPPAAAAAGSRVRPLPAPSSASARPPRAARRNANRSAWRAERAAAEAARLAGGRGEGEGGTAA